MDKWNLIFDVALCNHCACCSLAALDEYVGNDHPGYSAAQPTGTPPWLDFKRHERGQGQQVELSYEPQVCHHCDAAPCGAGQDEAVIKRPDGIVLMHPEKARGRRDLVGRCPYGAVHWNDALQLPQIWSFDAHLLDQGWEVPRCQQSCPTGALRALKVSDAAMQEIAQRDALAPLHPELRTAPRLHVRNLHRLRSRFMAGTVLQVRDGVADCLAGCSVSLIRADGSLEHRSTDWFGDFRFDGLPDQADRYVLEFTHPGMSAQRVEVVTSSAGTGVPEIRLKPASAAA